MRSYERKKGALTRFIWTRLLSQQGIGAARPIEGGYVTSCSALYRFLHLGPWDIQSLGQSFRPIATAGGLLDDNTELELGSRQQRWDGEMDVR